MNTLFERATNMTQPDFFAPIGRYGGIRDYPTIDKWSVRDDKFKPFLRGYKYVKVYNVIVNGEVLELMLNLSTDIRNNSDIEHDFNISIRYPKPNNFNTATGRIYGGYFVLAPYNTFEDIYNKIAYQSNANFAEDLIEDMVHSLYNQVEKVNQLENKR